MHFADWLGSDTPLKNASVILSMRVGVFAWACTCNRSEDISCSIDQIVLVCPADILPGFGCTGAA